MLEIQVGKFAYEKELILKDGEEVLYEGVVQYTPEYIDKILEVSKGEVEDIDEVVKIVLNNCYEDMKVKFANYTLTSITEGVLVDFLQIELSRKKSTLGSLDTELPTIFKR